MVFTLPKFVLIAFCEHAGELTVRTELAQALTVWSCILFGSVSRRIIVPPELSVPGFGVPRIAVERFRPEVPADRRLPRLASGALNGTTLLILYPIRKKEPPLH